MNVPNEYRGFRPAPPAPPRPPPRLGVHRLERHRLFGRQVDRRGVDLRRIGDEAEREIRPMDFGHRVADDARVMPGQPVLEQRVRDPNRDRRTVFTDERRRPEPAVEGVSADLRLNAREDLFPDVHPWCCKNAQDFRGYSTKSVQECVISAEKRGIRVTTCDFPQVFPQLWKTLGLDQTLIGFDEAGSTRKVGDCNTVRAPIDTPRNRPIPLSFLQMRKGSDEG